VTEDGRSVVKHYLQDVGSTFGMCNDLHEWDLSYEYFYEGGPTWKRFWSFGFALSPWQTAKYVEYPSIGKFEGDTFDPRKWRPQTPTEAYMELRDDDAFWAAQRVMAFSDEQIRAAVHTGEFTNPAAEKYLGDILIKRRNKIAAAYLTTVNPVVAPRLDAENRLTFANAAVEADVAKGPSIYHTSWHAFDNATGETRQIADVDSHTVVVEGPRSLPDAIGSFVAVDISAPSDARPLWHRPARAYFRRAADGWRLVGLERLPEKLPAERATQ
jgi:hypothetical protein